MVEPWPADAKRDRLVGDWHIYQRTGGHRTSTDDVVTAWHASQGWDSAPRRFLDLGCGIGSVLLTVAHRLRPEQSLGVEAQSQSVALAQRAITELPEGAPQVRVEQGDFRTLDFEQQPFDLITGSPPYFPVGTGVLPEDPQRLACRFETRGGVEDYCQVASQVLAGQGRFHLVFQTTWTSRVEAAAQDSGLHLVARCDIHSRSDRAEPFLTVYEFRRTPKAARPESETLAVRDSEGQVTPAYHALRHQLGYD